MSLIAPGSLGWFLRHELRLSWRYMAGAAGGRGRSIFIGLAVVGVTAFMLAFFLGLALYRRGPAMAQIPDIAAFMAVAIDGVCLFFGSLMIAQSLASATLTFHDRGDLDLLLASPVKPWKVLATRILVMAFNAMIFFQLLILPPLLTAVAIARLWGLLAFPVIIACLALVASSLGVVLAMGLFRLLGPRRTRTIAQLIGVATGLGIVIVTRLMPTRGEGGFGHMADALQSSSWGPAALWWSRAATGDPLGLGIVVLASVAIFAVVVRALGARFAADASVAAGEAQPVQNAARRKAPTTAFKRRGLRRIMVFKELKLLWRDPALISQVLLQVVYLPFVMFISLSRGQDSGNLIGHLAIAFCAGAMAYVSGQLAAGLGWLTISAEEAPELLACAPITADQAARSKVTAVVVPVALLLGVLSLGLAFFNPLAGLAAFVGSCLCAGVMAYMELWLQRPGKRSAFRMRARGSGSVWVSLLETLISALFGLTTGMVAAGTVFAFAPAFLLIALVGIVASVNREKWLVRYA